MRPKTNSQVYFSNIQVSKIKPSKLNPRRNFDPEKIAELADSFSEYGIIQPIIVYKNKSHYVIICGERRWRAASLANLKEVPAIVHAGRIKDESAVSMALIENLHRQNVDYVSESSAIRNLIETYNWSSTKVAKEIGVSSGYIRNRLLLTRYSDVLENFDKKMMTFSEAIELSSIKDKNTRGWFFDRLRNGEFENFKKFTEAVARFRYIGKIIRKNRFQSQPLKRSEVQFEVSGLPYCELSCEHYLRLTWEEKKHFGLPSKKPGWSEYCVGFDNDCYQKKSAAKKAYFESLNKIKEKRPIIDDGWESMLWFRYNKKMCKSCEHMVDAADFEDIGYEVDSDVFAYCVAPKSRCHNKRCEAYKKWGINRRNNELKEFEKRKTQILNQISQSNNCQDKFFRGYFTKRECTYLILQFLCYAGGKIRFENFAKKYSISSNMPSNYNAQVTYIRNKLMENLNEKELFDILFAEAASSAAYSLQEIEPLQFVREKQKEIPIIL